MRDIIERNVRKQIRQLRRDEITGMSMANLLQVTPTPPPELAVGPNAAYYYRQLFEEIAGRVAHDCGFEITTQEAKP